MLICIIAGGSWRVDLASFYYPDWLTNQFGKSNTIKELWRAMNLAGYDWFSHRMLWFFSKTGFEQVEVFYIEVYY
jgi:hypothetical protein